MVERPDVVGERQNLRRVELGSAHRRHTAAIVLRRWHALGDGRGDRGDAAVAPSPFAGGQVWRERRALGVGAVASGARAASRPWKICSPSFTCSAVCPGGAGRLPVTSAPASGCTPSGGCAWAVLPEAGACALLAGAGAGSTPTVFSPWKVTCQIRPCWSSAM